MFGRAVWERGVDRETGRFEIRDGRLSDAGPLAQAVYLASDGIALAMWAEMAGSGGDPWALGRERAAREEGAFSWRNARICERGGEVAGVLIGYPEPKTPEPMDPEAPPVFRPLMALEAMVPGTFYINVLATLEGHRRQGVGRALVADAAAQASGKDLSLIVAEGNAGARTFYAAEGFREIARAPVETGFGWEPDFAEWILMRREADAA